MIKFVTNLNITMSGKLYSLRILFFILLFGRVITVRSQSQVAIYNNTISISPSYTVTDGTFITAIGFVVNTGTANISTNISLQMAINTSTSGSASYSVVATHSFAVSSFSPGALESFSISTVASGANGFRTDGNGTTVVVWPFITNSGFNTYADSAFTIVTIGEPTGIKELEVAFSKDVIIQNPAGNIISLVYNETVYATPELISVEGKLIAGVISNKVIFAEKLARGIYYIRFYHKEHNRYFTRKLILN